MTPLAELAMRARASDQVVAELEADYLRLRQAAEEHESRRLSLQASVVREGFIVHERRVSKAYTAAAKTAEELERAQALYLDYALGPAWRHAQLTKDQKAAELSAYFWLKQQVPALEVRDLDYLARELAMVDWRCPRPRTSPREVIWAVVEVVLLDHLFLTLVVLFGLLIVVLYIWSMS